MANTWACHHRDLLLHGSEGGGSHHRLWVVWRVPFPQCLKKWAWLVSLTICGLSACSSLGFSHAVL